MGGGRRSERPNLLPVPGMGPGRGAAAGGKSSAAGASGNGESGGCCRSRCIKRREEAPLAALPENCRQPALIGLGEP